MRKLGRGNDAENNRWNTRRAWKDAFKTQPRGILRGRLGVGHITCMEEIIKAYGIFSKGLKKKKYLLKPKRRRKDNIKLRIGIVCEDMALKR
jgi:hypothetical protein